MDLTKPALAYDQGQGTDPTTGLPVNLPPIIRFFKNAAMRGHQAALDEMMDVHPSTSDVQGEIQASNPTVGRDYQPPDPEIGPPRPPADMEFGSTQPPDNSRVTQIQTPSSPLPKFFRPSFRDATQDANGLPLPIGPALTKGGALLHILGAAAQGGLNAWGAMSPAEGADRAREIPFEMAQHRQQLQASGLANQQAATNLRMTPLAIASKQADIAQTLAQTNLAEHGAHGQTYTRGPNGELQLTPIDTFGKPLPPIQNAVNPYEMHPHESMANGLIGINPESGEQFPVNFNKASGRYEDQFQRPIPNEWIRQVSMLPKTTSESQTTDLLGNRSTRRTTAPVLPTAGGVRVSRNVAQSAPGVLPSASSSTPRGAGNVQTGNPVLDSLDPKSRSYLQTLLEYKGKLPSPRSPQYGQVLGLLHQADPSFDEKEYDARQGLLSDFTRGKGQFAPKGAINMAMGHLTMLADAADALNNGDVPALNRIANAYKVATGQAPVPVFNAVKNAVNGELSKIFRGGGVATDSAVGEQEQALNSAESPDQIRKVIRADIGLMKSRMDAMQYIYESGMGKPLSHDLLSPEARAAWNRLSASPGTHAFSKSAFQTNNPHADVNAAAAAAQADGLQVID